MTRYILIIFFSFLVTTINAQVATRTVSGKITDSETHEAVIGAKCKAVNAQGKILTYATTDGTGNYKLRITDGALRMIVSAMGYTEQSFEASAIKEYKNISLRPETYSLKEVPVTVNPIEINKDTIKYNVSSFKTRNDKYIEDVLRKMPGIEVNSSGQILYKGESINQFNIEGQNLLGNRYKPSYQKPSRRRRSASTNCRKRSAHSRPQKTCTQQEGNTQHKTKKFIQAAAIW